MIANIFDKYSGQKRLRKQPCSQKHMSICGFDNMSVGSA